MRVNVVNLVKYSVKIFLFRVNTGRRGRRPLQKNYRLSENYLDLQANSTSAPRGLGVFSQGRRPPQKDNANIIRNKIVPYCQFLQTSIQPIAPEYFSNSAIDNRITLHQPAAGYTVSNRLLIDPNRPEHPLLRRMGKLLPPHVRRVLPLPQVLPSRLSIQKQL